MTLTHLSLCTGIGGIDLAAEWAGFTTVGQCEIDEYASRVLAKNFKGVPNLHDIRTVDNARLRAYGIEPENITLLSAGFPCQPYSLAGKGRGDGDKRDLWGEVKRCIGEIGPRWFVGENTPGLFARAGQRYFKRILSDLAEMGYSVSWGIWGAVDVGAPHERKRVFICTHRNADCEHAKAKSEIQEDGFSSGGVCRGVPDATCERCNKSEVFRRESEKSGKEAHKRRIQSCGLQSFGVRGSISGAAAEFQCNQRSESYWQTEPDVGRVAYGISSRVDKLRCLGNAVVPYQIYPLLQVIADYENGRCK